MQERKKNLEVPKRTNWPREKTLGASVLPKKKLSEGLYRVVVGVL
jgi:hypothetical protein